MAFDLPKLKYAADALDPYLSERVVSIHYNKHTAKYFETMNKLIKGTPFDEETDLTKMVSKDTLLKADSKLYNNACQAWNHIFYFNSLAPVNTTGKPSDKLMEAIKQDIGSFDDKFKETLIEAGKNVFGSGWVWLVLKDNKLHIKTTPNAGNPLSQDRTVPLMCIDVWEHSYYLQYEYDRAEYLYGTWNLINWNEINERYADAKH